MPSTPAFCPSAPQAELSIQLARAALRCSPLLFAELLLNLQYLVWMPHTQRALS